MNDMDTFDRFLEASLAGGEELPAAFSRRVMERVRRTPQDSPRRVPLTHRTVAWAAGLAACCAIVLLALPYVSPKGAQADSADFAAPESAMLDRAAPDDGTQNTLTAAGMPDDGDLPNDGFLPNDGGENTLTAAGVPDEKFMSGDTAAGVESAAVYYAADEETQALRQWLDEQGIPADGAENGRLGYSLTAEETQALRTALPALLVWEQTLPEGQPLTLWLAEDGQ